MVVLIQTITRKTVILHCAATKYGTVKSTKATRIGVVLASAITKVEKLLSPDKDYRDLIDAFMTGLCSDKVNRLFPNYVYLVGWK